MMLCSTSSYRAILQVQIPRYGVADRKDALNNTRRRREEKEANPFVQPPSPWMNERPLGVDVNVGMCLCYALVDLAKSFSGGDSVEWGHL